MAIGGGSVYASLGVSFGVTNADTVYDLVGSGISAGGGSTWTGSWEYVRGLDEWDQTTWKGIELTVGPILTPEVFLGMEFHAYRTETVILPIGQRQEKSEVFWDMLGQGVTWGQAHFLLGHGMQFLD